MCGIAGIISLQADDALVHPLKSMTDRLVHRGPEGEGFWKNRSSQVHFGHRRLCIIDLSAAGAQPMHYLDRYTIVYNGEIYNYKEIREDLLKKGFRFHSQTDTEVVLAAYACYGEACLSRFDGMFAFAIWDEAAQRLFAARDRFGEKPFFYCRLNGRLIFASEIKALWAAGMKKKENLALLYNFLTVDYTGNPADPAETFFEGVYKLPAGSLLRYHLPSRQLTTGRYWKLEISRAAEENSNKTEQFMELLQASVQKRLRSDVPVGTSLSGGLDSSAIVALMKKGYDSTGSIKTFSAVFPGYEKDESRFIRSVQQKLDIENYQTSPAAKDLVADFDKLCDHQDEPFISSSMYAQYAVFGLAKKRGVTVLLDGQGADEILAGYNKYYHWYWQELYRTDRKKFRWETAQARRTGVGGSWSWQNRMAAFFPGIATGLQKWRREKQQRCMYGLHPEFVRAYGYSYYTLPRTDRLENVLYYNTISNGLEELLRYADRNSMAHSREVRLPFLQHELVEFIFSLPPHWKIRDARTKWILRNSMENMLPAEVVWRLDKVGFEPPQQQWMQHPQMQACIREQKLRLAQAGIFKKEEIKPIKKPHEIHAAPDNDWRLLVAGKLCI